MMKVDRVARSTDGTIELGRPINELITSDPVVETTTIEAAIGTVHGISGPHESGPDDRS